MTEHESTPRCVLCGADLTMDGTLEHNLGAASDDTRYRETWVCTNPECTYVETIIVIHNVGPKLAH